MAHVYIMPHMEESCHVYNTSRIGMSHVTCMHNAAREKVMSRVYYVTYRNESRHIYTSSHA